MQSIKDYWDARANEIGHTGWNSPFYKLDQFSRLTHVRRVIGRILAQTNSKHSFKFLDFGCGTGDFSQMMQSLGGSGIGVDISPAIVTMARNKNLSGVEFKTDLPSGKEVGGFDIILAVTVFQHILDDENLLKVLDKLKHLCNEKAHIIIIEKVDVKTNFANAASSEYLRARCKEDWDQIINKAGLKIKKTDYYPQNLIHFFDGLVEIFLRRSQTISPKKNVVDSSIFPTTDFTKPNKVSILGLIKSFSKSGLLVMLCCLGFVFDCVIRRNIFPKRALQYHTFVLSND